MFEELIFLITYIPILLITARFYSNILAPEYAVTAAFTKCVCYFIVAGVPTAFIISNYHSLGSFVFKIILLFPCILFFRGETLKRIMVGFIALTTGYMAEVASAFPIRLINLLLPETNLQPLHLLIHGQYILYLLLSSVSVVINFLCFCSLWRLLKKCYMFLNTKIIVQLDLPLLAALLLGDFMLILSYTHLSSRQFLTCLILYWAGCTMCFITVNSGLKTLELQEKKRYLQKQQKELLQTQLICSQEITDMIHSGRKWNHDYSGHLQAIMYLLNQGNYSEAEQYITDLYQSLQAYKT